MVTAAVFLDNFRDFTTSNDGISRSFQGNVLQPLQPPDSNQGWTLFNLRTVVVKEIIRRFLGLSATDAEHKIRKKARVGKDDSSSSGAGKRDEYLCMINWIAAAVDGGRRGTDSLSPLPLNKLSEKTV